MAKKQKKIRKIVDEFKKFITRGNVVDLAVGVVIGGAFTAIVNALSNNIFKPLVSFALASILGKDGLSGAVTTLGEITYLEDGETIDLANTIHINWGTFISAILNFFIVAIVLFIVIKVMNSVRENSEKIVKTSQERVRERKLAKLMKKNEHLRAKGKPEIAIPKELLPPQEEVVETPPPAPAPAPVDSQVELLKEIRDLLTISREK